MKYRDPVMKLVLDKSSAISHVILAMIHKYFEIVIFNFMNRDCFY